MRFSSFHKSGRGRGKEIGFPTLNLQIPDEFVLEIGVYAATVRIGNSEFMGAMHYGPVPVFDEAENSLEIYLLNIDDTNFPDTANKKIEVEVKKYIREIRTFPDPKSLAEQIKNDVDQIQSYLASLKK